MAQIVWSPRARQDLHQIVKYISADSPVAARRFVQRVLGRVRHLRHFPQMGSTIAEDQSGTYREVLQGNYRVIYRIDGDKVRIATIFHAARLLGSADLP